jgi:hypothetical protein
VGLQQRAGWRLVTTDGAGWAGEADGIRVLSCRFESLTQAAGYLRRICDRSLFTLPLNLNLGFYRWDMLFGLLWVGIMLVVEWVQRGRAHGLELNINSQPVRYIIYILLLFLIYFWDANNPAGFIYFQF